MDDLRKVLSTDALLALRQRYDRDAMRAAMLNTTVAPYPPMADWNRAIASTFYGDQSPVAPRDRERCLIALLAQKGAQFSLGVHVYWGLMEGLSPDEICHTIGLAACYGGIASLGQSFPVLETVLGMLAQISATGDLRAMSTSDVLARLVTELTKPRQS